MKFSAKEKSRLKSRYGPWALVTGASSGIGMELAERLAEAGFHLLICSRNGASLRKLQQQWQGKYGVEVKTIAADVSDPMGIEAIIDAAKKPEIGLVVLSAGFGTAGLFLNSSLPAEVNMLRVNCEAVLSFTHHFSQRFSQQQRGGIILLSSLVAFQGVPYAASYAATKAWVQSLAEALAVELKPYGVDVLAAVPGPVKSGFAQRANMRMNNAVSPRQLGVPILSALGRRSQVVPGALSKLLTWSLRTVPRFAKIRIMQKIMGGFTLHQRQ